MIKIIFLVLVVFIGFFMIYVGSRPSAFRYERSGLIKAAPEKIYPYLRDFKLGSEWSPYEKLDPNMKKKYSGPERGVGSIMEFEGNRNTGSGRLEILKEVPNTLVEIKLEMLKPIAGSNEVEYRLTPEGAATRFTWSMSGDSGFMGKLVGVFINCEKMVGDQFSQGIQNLKTVVEIKN